MYDISDFTSAGADFATYLIANDGIGLAAAIEGPAADAYFYGTGSTLIGGIGGAADGQLVIASNYGIAFNAGAGAGSVFAGTFPSLVSSYPSPSNNQILLGAGSVSVVSAEWDLIAGGSGSGTSLVQGGPGFPTIVGTTGADTIATQGRSMVWLGANTDVVNSAGPGAFDFTGGAGAATILGRAAQVTISGFNPTLDYLSLQAFPAGEAAAALAGASFSGGSETLALSDGTHITFSGFTALTSNHFL